MTRPITPPTPLPPRGHSRRIVTARTRRDCGGSVYLAVLGAAMLVALIGISGVLVNRVQYRIAEAGEGAAEAQLLARAAIELAIHRVADNPGWRGTYQHDQWTTPQTLGTGTVEFKLRDDDGSLLDNPEDPVRIIGRGQVGNAMRMTSILLKMDATHLQGFRVVAGSWQQEVESP